MHTEVRSIIRSQITPYAQVQTYPTGWAGRQTSTQLYGDLVEYAANVMKRNGLQPHERTECLQIGFTALLETLKSQHNFLADKARQQAVFFILARCKSSSLRAYDRRHESLEAYVATAWRSLVDEHVITGYEHDRDERWAAWATDVDTRIDIERIMHKLAAKYIDSFKHLIALYYITTQISRKDAAALAGLTPWNWMQNYVEPVLQDVRYEFARVFLEQHDYPQPEFKPIADRPHDGRFTTPYGAWREQYRSGHIAPAMSLLERYRHTPCVSHALQAQIDGKTYTQAAFAVGRNPKSFRRHMKRAVKLLAAAYA
jgi:hypothetical protein